MECSHKRGDTVSNPSHSSHLGMQLDSRLIEPKSLVTTLTLSLDLATKLTLSSAMDIQRDNAEKMYIVKRTLSLFHYHK